MHDLKKETIVYYDWDKGMDRNKEGLMIWVDGKYIQVNDVQFFDTVRGFIQTKTAVYMPEGLKKVIDAN